MNAARALGWAVQTRLVGWTPHRNRRLRATSATPLPPDGLIAAVSCRRDVAHFLETGAATHASICATWAAANLPLTPGERVLDLGAGCGRVLRHAIAAGPSAVRWAACDRDAHALAWLGRAFPRVEIATCADRPPVPFAGAFDRIFAISVFTHLPARAQLAWFGACAAALVPGGTLLFSTQGEAFRSALRRREREPYARGCLVVRSAALAGSNVCDVFHPPAWVHAHVEPRWDILAHRPAADRGYPGQDHWLLRKR